MQNKSGCTEINQNCTSNQKNDSLTITQCQNTNIGSKSGVEEYTIVSTELKVERKAFIFMLKKNQRGRFLRITEDVGVGRSTVIIPSTGLVEFQKAIEEMVKISEIISEKGE